MSKRIISATISPEVVDYIDRVSEMNSVSRSKAIELLINIVQDYFSDNQICQEHIVRGVIDGRTK